MVHWFAVCEVDRGLGTVSEMAMRGDLFLWFFFFFWTGVSGWNGMMV